MTILKVSEFLCVTVTAVSNGQFENGLVHGHERRNNCHFTVITTKT